MSRKRLSLLIALLFSHGCITEEDDAADAGPDAAPPPAEWFACGAAADCVVFEAECCDHCNGGHVVSVNRAHLDAARARLQDTDCEGAACTERGCAPVIPTCDDGVCGAEPDPTWGDPCAGLDEAACAATPACRPQLGAPAAEYCIDDLSHWRTVYGGCQRVDIACGEAETCAIRPGDGQRFVFPDTCTPAGWAACEPDACTAPAACAVGSLADIGSLCVRGTPAGAMERLEAGRVTLQVFPAGCFSSSCTRRLDIACRVGPDLQVSAGFCLAAEPEPEACTDDCGGGGSAECFATDVADGTHTATLGDLSLTFEVPSLLPAGGQCVGDRF